MKNLSSNMVYGSTAYSLLNLMMFGARALDTLCRDQGVCYCRAGGTEENGREGGMQLPLQNLADFDDAKPGQSNDFLPRYTNSTCLPPPSDLQTFRRLCISHNLCKNCAGHFLRNNLLCSLPGPSFVE